MYWDYIINFFFYFITLFAMIFVSVLVIILRDFFSLNSQFLNSLPLFLTIQYLKIVVLFSSALVNFQSCNSAIFPSPSSLLFCNASDKKVSCVLYPKLESWNRALYAIYWMLFFWQYFIIISSISTLFSFQGNFACFFFIIRLFLSPSSASSLPSLSPCIEIWVIQ